MELIDSLSINTAIHCQTSDEDCKVREILNKENFCWSNENSITISRYYDHKSDTCIIPFQGVVRSINSITDQYEIIKASDFIHNYNKSKPKPIKIALSHAKYELAKLYSVSPDLIIIEP